MDKYAGFDFESLKKAGESKKGSTFGNFKQAQDLPYNGNYPPGVNPNDVGGIDEPEEDLEDAVDRFLMSGGHKRLVQAILENGTEGITPEMADHLSDVYDPVGVEDGQIIFRLNIKKIDPQVAQKIVPIAPQSIQVSIQ